MIPAQDPKQQDIFGIFDSWSNGILEYWNWNIALLEYRSA